MKSDEPRYSVQEAFDYYSVVSTLLEGKVTPAWAVLDEQAGGYIAFCTDKASAERIVAALAKGEA